jgi:hypothetical protein
MLMPSRCHWDNNGGKRTARSSLTSNATLDSGGLEEDEEILFESTIDETSMRDLASPLKLSRELSLPTLDFCCRRNSLFDRHSTDRPSGEEDIQDKGLDYASSFADLRRTNELEGLNLVERMRKWEEGGKRTDNTIQPVGLALSRTMDPDLPPSAPPSSPQNLIFPSILSPTSSAPSPTSPLPAGADAAYTGRSGCAVSADDEGMIFEEEGSLQILELTERLKGQTIDAEYASRDYSHRYREFLFGEEG